MHLLGHEPAVEERPLRQVPGPGVEQGHGLLPAVLALLVLVAAAALPPSTTPPAPKGWPRALRRLLLLLPLLLEVEVRAASPRPSSTSRKSAAVGRAKAKPSTCVGVRPFHEVDAT